MFVGGHRDVYGLSSHGMRAMSEDILLLSQLGAREVIDPQEVATRNAASYNALVSPYSKRLIRKHSQYRAASALLPLCPYLL